MKPGAFTQLYTHLIFAVKYRERLLTKNIRDEVFRYISGIIINRRHKSIIINGMPDHIHILVGLNPDDKISDLVGSIKKNSSVYINEKKLFHGTFHWQDGYGAFSYYILNQETHHKERTFREEYTALLNKYEIQYDEKFLFEFFE